MSLNTIQPSRRRRRRQDWLLWFTLMSSFLETSQSFTTTTTTTLPIGVPSSLRPNTIYTTTTTAIGIASRNNVEKPDDLEQDNANAAAASSDNTNTNTNNESLKNVDLRLNKQQAAEEDENTDVISVSHSNANLRLPNNNHYTNNVHSAWRHHHEATVRLVHHTTNNNNQDDTTSSFMDNNNNDDDESAQGNTPDNNINNNNDSPPTNNPPPSNNNNNNNNMNPVSNLISRLRNKSQLVSTTLEWKKLQKHKMDVIDKHHLRSLLQDTHRCNELYAQHDGVYVDYSRQCITLETLDLLMKLAHKQSLGDKIKAMREGQLINFTEQRAVLHTALRADRADIGTVIVNNDNDNSNNQQVDAIGEVHQVLDQVKEFTDGVRSGAILGYTGKRLRNIVSVGIGGSYLGPEFLHESLKTEPEGINNALGYSLRFLSNVDPVDVERTCADLDPEETLIVIVSKTFTTAETMLNARTMRQWLWDFMGNDPNVVRKHVVACASDTSIQKVAEFGIDTENYFFRFWDWVGGRYSVCSAAGAVPISLLYGYELFEKFLQGARSMDQHFFNAPFEKNIPVILGLLGVWNMSFLGYNTRTTLPYGQALLKLPAHIQQVDMESNGKYMTKDNLEVDYPVGEVDFGEPGTNGQHSFYQLLHMGQTVPCDFIGFVQSQHDLCLEGEELSSHDELMANFFAQPDALATGKTETELRHENCPEELIPHRTFKGNRPSTSLLLPKLTAYATGQILAMYEHRTAVQGFIWDINSFDQYGVELGKKLALNVRDHLKKARTNGDSTTSIEAENPATSRILNYYLKNSSQNNNGDASNANPETKDTNNDNKSSSQKKTTTSRNHDFCPPATHNLGGKNGKLH